MEVKTILVRLPVVDTGFEMTISVPDSEYAIEYIDDFLGFIFQPNIREICRWDFL